MNHNLEPVAVTLLGDVRLLGAPQLKGGWTHCYRPLGAESLRVETPPSRGARGGRAATGSGDAAEGSSHILWSRYTAGDALTCIQSWDSCGAVRLPVARVRPRFLVPVSGSRECNRSARARSPWTESTGLMLVLQMLQTDPTDCQSVLVEIQIDLTDFHVVLSPT